MWVLEHLFKHRLSTVVERDKDSESERVGEERENESGRKKEVKWEVERSEGQFSGVVKQCC